MTNKYWMDDSYRDNAMFNEIAGNHVKLSLKDLFNQEKLIAEEAKELKEALDENNPVEVLDAIIDLYVVLDGFATKLEAVGFDISTGLKQTIENNMSKFPDSKEVADKTVEYYSQQGITTFTEYNEKYDRWIIKDTNGKIRKPYGFVSNDLSNCVPEGFTKFE